MNKKLIFIGVIAFAVVLRARSQSAYSPESHIFCFYYNWYGSLPINGANSHWAHPVMKSSPADTASGFIPGGDNISSNFFPQLGAYSSSDPSVVAAHIKMLKKARIGVLALTWWDKADVGLESVPLIMNEAAKAGLKVCFHIEPFRGRNAQTTRQNIKTIIEMYGSHPAFYRINAKPLFFVYDSYLTKADEWADLLQPNGKITMRNTPDDAIMIGLWVKKGEEDFFERSGFDGFYTYFGATDFTYGSSPANWNGMQAWAVEHKKIFIPCVGPGYIDTRVRPWNGKTTRDRGKGKYYDQMFKQAIDSKASFIGITSFNEWHEGTQIEPAVPFQIDAFRYLDYSPLAPDYYLSRTAYWVSRFAKEKKITHK